MSTNISVKYSAQEDNKQEILKMFADIVNKLDSDANIYVSVERESDREELNKELEQEGIVI